MVLKLNSKRKVKRKVCNGQEITITPYVNDAQIEDILNRITNTTNKRIEDGEDFIFALRTAHISMDICLIYYLTDIENGVEDYEKLVTSGVIQTIHDAIVNYKELESMVNSVVQTCFVSSTIPNAKSIGNDLEKLQKFMDGMTDTDRENFNSIIKASMSNSMMNKIKGGEL